ncbi:Hypothetical protein POVR1_LOCUS127 [uncultured virus]|nr:Hypothetical protein POVR1_LOCUS127 [uncultured virus]
MTGVMENWPECGRDVDFPLPSVSTRHLVGTKFPGSDFLIFTQETFNGPITNEGIRLTTYSNATFLHFRWKITPLVTTTRPDLYHCQSDLPCVTIAFYSTDVVEPQDPNMMYPIYAKDRIAIFQATKKNQYSGEFVGFNLNQLFVNLPTDVAVRVDLSVSVVPPYNRKIPCLQMNVPYIKYLKINRCEVIPVYSLLLVKNGSSDEVIKTPFPWFQQLAIEINRIFNLTALSLLLPIVPQPTPPPVTYNDVPIVLSNPDADVLSYYSITDSLGPDIYIDYWFGSHYGFKLFSNAQMVPLISYELFVQTGPFPAQPDIVITPTVELLYMTYASTFKVHAQLNQTTGNINGPARQVLSPISASSSQLYTGNFLLAPDSVDFCFAVSFSSATSLELPTLAVSLSTITITYIPKPSA